MTDGVHNVHQDYWLPLNASKTPADPARQETPCSCGTAFLPGARYCHSCGRERRSTAQRRVQPGVASWLNVERIRDLTGLSNLMLALAIVGAICALGALMIGWLQPTDTIEEWQAVQLWRIQWLLGAAVSFLAVIALKRVPSTHQ